MTNHDHYDHALQRIHNTTWHLNNLQHALLTQPTATADQIIHRLWPHLRAAQHALNPLDDHHHDPYNQHRPTTPTTGGHMTAYKQRLEAGDYLPPPNAEDLEEATVADLKTQLSDRGLPVSGSKQELIDRLANANSDPADETE